MCIVLNNRIKMAMKHALYVGGLTFFSSLSAEFIDRILTIQEIKFCFIAAAIAFGLSFFTSMALQRKNGTYSKLKEKPNKIKKVRKAIKLKTRKTFNKHNKKGQALFWRGLFDAVHSPQNCVNCF